MGHFNLIATDLDGTLLRSDGTLSTRTRATLHAARRSGVMAVFVTARPPRAMTHLAEQVGLKGLAVCCNGSILFDLEAQSMLFHERLESRLAQTMIKRLRLALPGIAFAIEQGTSERIRDKIAASKAKAKGMWMGGNLPLGYDVRDRALVINPAEAEQVRAIFNRYLVLGSVNALKAELDEAGATSKVWTTRSGSVRGGQPWSRGALFHVLKNPIYIGRVPHKGESHAGLHQPIVDLELFDRVQHLLTANAVERKERPTRVGASPLRGLMFDEAGMPMTPSFGQGKGGRAYRYYVSAAPKAAAAKSQIDITRVSAPPIEALVKERIERLGSRTTERWQDCLRRVELRPQLVELLLDPAFFIDRHEESDRALVRLKALLLVGDKLMHTDQGLLLVAPVRAVFRGGRTWLVGPQGAEARMGARPNIPLIKALSRAHRILDQNQMHPSTAPEDLAEARSPADSFQRVLAPLAFLAPDIQLAIIEGRQPAGLTLEQLLRRKLPLAWTDQRTALGFPPY